MFILAFLMAPFFVQAQVYVKGDAAGSNDGTSWDNAYTNLSDALSGATAGSEIWIAAGTYNPTSDVTDTLASFTIDKELTLYGGFAGTESMLTERDPANNKSILSGDTAGDDVEDDFANNKSDNVKHVVYVDSLIGAKVTFDGLEVTGGHGYDDADAGLFLSNGGGIFSLSPLTVNNCTFYGNFARAGGSLYAVSAATGGVSDIDITNSTFRNNSATSQSGGIFIDSASDILIDNCTFTLNSTARGACYPLFCDNVTISNCDFIENVNLTGTAAGLFAWNNTNFTVSDCNFLENEAQWGSGMFVSGNTTPGNSLVMNDCKFEGNIAVNGGGAYYLFASIFEMNNVEFAGNECDFAAAGFHDGSAGNMNNCTWDGNTSARGGGTDLVGFLADVTYNDCLMTNNEGGWGAGLFIQNDLTRVAVNNCEFSKNSTTQGGGGGVYALSGSILDVDGCIFESNSSSTTGGAILSLEDSLNTNVVTVNNTIFTLNSAGGQGGAINTGNTELLVTNSIFFQNFADDDGNTPPGRGGAISNNASSYVNLNEPTAGLSESDTSRITLINNTFVENDGFLAGGVAQWEYVDDTLNANAVLVMANNIFYNTDDLTAPHYANEAGTPITISLGGNLSFTDLFGGGEVDTSLYQYFTEASDIKGVDPMMEDPLGEMYKLMTGSPCIDAGVMVPGLPAEDFEGDARDDMPDIGADEFILTISTQDLVDNSILKFAPNPARDVTQLTLDNDWAGEMRILIVNTSGQTVKRLDLEKPAGLWNHDLQIGDLAAGAYQIAITNGQSVVVKSLIKL
ncbi:MAG: right-handed parallel beta-helix repeat-containing protein [Bacteroidota bacterium]